MERVDYQEMADAPFESLLILHDACYDFTDQIENSRNAIALLKRTLNRTQPENEYVELDDVCAVVVAAELVATVRGWPPENLSRKAREKVRRAFEADSSSLPELTSFALQWVEWLRTGHHELADASPYWADIGALLAQLVGRLREPARPLPAPPERIRPRAGDVFRIPMGDGRFSYWRMHKRGFLHVYNATLREGEHPPIGSRNFLFYTSAHVRLLDVVGSVQCPLVARDPVSKNEAVPLCCNKDGFNRISIFGDHGPWGVDIQVSAWQIIGMELIRHDSLQTLRDRIASDRCSVKESMKHFSRDLKPADVDRALAILKGRRCRRFDIEEHRAFGLMDDDIRPIKWPTVP